MTKSPPLKRIEKVKLTDEQVEIHYTVLRKGTIRDEFMVISKDRPIPQFRGAMQAFDTYVERLCEFTKKQEPEITVTGISISYSDKGLPGVVVTAKKEIAGCNAPFCFNTPHVQEAAEETETSLDATATTKLAEVIKQAQMYLDGERLQGELPFKKDDKEK